MRVFVPSLSVALFAAVSAQAGGYVPPVVETPAPQIVEALPEPSNWTGGYAGITLGYAFAPDDEVGISENEKFITTLENLEPTGLGGSLRIGYRKQFEGSNRNWVVGGELSYEKSNVSDDFVAGGYKAAVEMNNTIALRVKTGLLNQAQDTLFYGIAGLGRADYDYSVVGNGVAGVVAIDESSVTHTGYIVGLGVERKLSERLSVTGEWEYANFGKSHLDDVLGKSTEATPKHHSLNIGLNFQF